MTEKQVVSKKRVADHGEVLTGKREVNAMLDLVKPETDRWSWKVSKEYLQNTQIAADFLSPDSLSAFICVICG